MTIEEKEMSEDITWLREILGEMKTDIRDLRKAVSDHTDQDHDDHEAVQAQIRKLQDFIERRAWVLKIIRSIAALLFGGGGILAVAKLSYTLYHHTW